MSESSSGGIHATTDENEVVDNEMYLQGMTIDRNWEISQDRLLLTEERLGGGEFGIVTKGIYLRTDGNELPVAVKRLKGEHAFPYLRVGMEDGWEGSRELMVRV